MNQIIKNLTSRKFLLAVAAFITCVAHGNVPAAVTVVLGYFGVNYFDNSGTTPPTPPQV